MMEFILQLIFIKVITNCKKDCVKILSSIVNEAIGTIYLFIFFIKIFCIKKKTNKLLFKYLNMPRSIIKHTSNFHITPRSIIKHTSNFQLEITPRSIKKTNNFSFKYFYMHNKAHKQLSFRYYVQKYKKNKQLFVQRQLVQDVMNNFSLRYMLKKRIVGTRCNE